MIIDKLLNLLADVANKQKSVKEVRPNVKKIVAELRQHAKTMHVAKQLLDSICMKKVYPNSAYKEQQPHIRSYNSVETAKLGHQGQRYLLQLEQLGVIDASLREQIIDASLTLVPGAVDLDDLKLITLSVLISYYNTDDVLRGLRMLSNVTNQKLH